MSNVPIFVSLLFLALVTGCGSSDVTPIETPLDVDVEPVNNTNVYTPNVMDTWQWQLMIAEENSAVNTAYNVDIYDVDLFDTLASSITQIQDSGSKVICYFSAGSYENWRDDESLFPSDALGNNLDGWEGERWLDIRLKVVHDIMYSRLSLAADKGCDGVEPDNMDAYQNESGFALTANDQLAYNRFIANTAHTLSLSVGLKNDLDQISDLLDYFDFAVNEQCFEYDECDKLVPFIDAGKPVFNAEYHDDYVSNTNNARITLCIDANALQFSTLILPLNLDDEFRFSCI